MEHDTDLPLFSWMQPCKFIPFPMVNRVGKIRDVAAKMLDKPTDRHAGYYREQVNAGLLKQFAAIGLPEELQHEQLSLFWEKVRDEMIRQTYHRSAGLPPGGAA